MLSNIHIHMDTNTYILNSARIYKIFTRFKDINNRVCEVDL